MIKIDNKGTTLVEITVSIALISVILIFLLNIVIDSRISFTTSQKEVDYRIISSTIIQAIGNDIKDYGLESVEYIESSIDKSAILLTFNDYRPSNLSEKIKKVLKIYKDSYGKQYIRYTYDIEQMNKGDIITTKERLTSITRELPEDVILDELNVIHLNKNEEIPAIEIKIPIKNGNYTNYDINIYGLLT